MDIRLLFIICILIVSSGHPSLACDCLESVTTKKAVRQADIVAIVKVIGEETWYRDSTSDIFVNRKYPQNVNEVQSRFKCVVVESFKGKLTSDTVTVITPYGGETCGFEFELGKKYVLYGEAMVLLRRRTGKPTGKKIPNVFETNSCLRTSVADEKAVTEVREAIK